MKNKPYPLIISVICCNPQKLIHLCQSIGTIAQNPCLKSISVLVLLNGITEIDETQFCFLKKYRINIHCINLDQQEQDRKNGFFGSSFPQQKGISCICIARTMLHRYCYEFIQNSQEPHRNIAWQVDEDMVIDAQLNDILNRLPELKKQGIDILIGGFKGDTPNASLTTLRGQVQDVYENLLWLQTLQPNITLPDRGLENDELRSAYPEYYYDFANSKESCQHNYWLTPIHNHETVAQARERLLDSLFDILKGKLMTRAMMAKNTAQLDLKDSYNLGGNGFILNPECLIQAPNISPAYRDKFLRRSDMNWCVINHFVFGNVVKRSDFFIQHARQEDNIPYREQFKKLELEIQGSCFHKALFTSLKEESNFLTGADNINRFPELYDHFIIKRLSILKTTAREIRTLVASFNELKETDNRLILFLQHIHSLFSEDSIQRLEKSTRSLPASDLINYLKELPFLLKNYSDSSQIRTIYEIRQ